MELKDISGISNQMTMKKVGGKQQQQSIRVTRVNLAPKRKLREAGTQTDNGDQSDVDLITGDEPPRKYLILQSEEREKIINQLLQENEKLQNRIEYLEKENVELESMLGDATKLAEMISSMPDDPDESGIVRDHPEDD